MSSVTNQFFCQDALDCCFLATVHENGKELCVSTSQFGVLNGVKIVSISPDKVKELIVFLLDNFGGI